MDQIKIGKIVNTHGIRGELKVACEDFSLFEKNMEIFIQVGKEFVTYKIQTLRKHKNHLLITSNEYDNINQILHFKGCDIFIPRLEGELYESDLIGFKIVEDNNVLGVITEIISNSAHDTLVLDNNIMIPYVDEFVKEIVEEDKSIIVELIEGMRNEY